MKKVAVRLKSNSYDIIIGSGLLSKIGQLLQEMGYNDRLVIITDSAVKGLYGTTLRQSLSKTGFSVSLLEVPAGEEQKSLETAGRLYKELTAAQAERNTPIVALGGGVVGDLAGFVAATYLRGVPLVQIPTTLLAQVDSSVGGKVAVDCGSLKNRIGAFYQPRAVFSDIDTLKTLPARQFSNGLAEVIKYAVICDAEFFVYLDKNLDQILALDDKALETIVARSTKLKAGVVQKDERDLGLRNILNYGHTTGHAIESVSNFTIQHGEAVAIGMVVAARISRKMGMLANDDVVKLKRLIARAGLPVQMPQLNTEKLLQAMKYDKKMAQGKVKFVLPKSIGEVVVTDEVNPILVEEALVTRHEKS